jgi:hypothetical protein
MKFRDQAALTMVQEWRKAAFSAALASPQIIDVGSVVVPEGLAVVGLH